MRACGGSAARRSIRLPAVLRRIRRRLGRRRGRALERQSPRLLWPETESAFRDVGWRRSAGCGAGAGGRHSGGIDPSDGESDAGVRNIGSAVIDVTPGDYFELIARQTSGSTKNVAADELTWFAI